MPPHNYEAAIDPLTGNPPDVRLKLGPFLIGVLANVFLYGVLCMQTLTYHQSFKDDRKVIKYLVYYLFVLATLNMGLDVGVVYEPLVKLWGTEHATRYIPSLFASEPVIIGAISTPIQFFLAHRIKRISNSIWIPLAICLLGLVSLGASVWTTIRVKEVALFEKKPMLHVPALIWLLSSAVADVMLTACLVHILYKKKTGFKATDTLINKLIVLTVQTGMITAIFAIADVVLFMSVPLTAINFIADLTLSKLYVNSIMSTLNSRANLNNAWHAAIQEPNFIFDDDTGESASNHRRGDIISLGNRSAHNSGNHNLDSSLARGQVLELESNKSFGNTRYSVEHNQDNSFIGGISITVDKMVETVEDPIPSAKFDEGAISHRNITQ